MGFPNVEWFASYCCSQFAVSRKAIFTHGEMLQKALDNKLTTPEQL